jgi:type II secretory ATPase GspE/PulE/Tfp pilus assembly ATPase PilB-like protein
MHLSDDELKQLLISSGAVKAEALSDLLTPHPGVAATLEPLASLVVQKRLITQAELDKLYTKAKEVPITPVPLSIPTNTPVALVPPPVLKTPPPTAKPKVVVAPPKALPGATDDISIAKTVSVIIEYAIKSRASDIHIEPRETIVQVRYRIDGLLHETMTLPKAVLPAVTKRIRTLSRLDLAKTGHPQEGRFSFKTGKQSLVLRVSILPVLDGEKVVLRLIDENARPLSLAELGFEHDALVRVAREIHQPHGLILATGPNASGKSTTLYSLVSLLEAPGVNLSTIEDPIEYRLPGANQTQVDNETGMTMAAGLRSVMSQDPNIILVGETRDRETADLSIQAALTGDLVLSALHTDNAATAISRLLEMGIEPFLIASTVKLIIGQRLARRICTKCRISYVPTGDTMTALKHDFQLDAALKAFRGTTGTEAAPAPTPASTAPIIDTTMLPSNLKMVQPERVIEGVKGILDRITADPNIINRSMAEAEEKKTKPAQPTPTATPQAAPPPDPTKLKHDEFILYKAGPGCDQCSHNGYAGRIAIYEVMEIDELVSKMIISRGRADMIEEAAVRSGMVTMHQDGLVKCLEGLTTVEEVLRVTREFDR